MLSCVISEASDSKGVRFHVCDPEGIACVILKGLSSDVARLLSSSLGVQMGGTPRHHSSLLLCSRVDVTLGLL